MHSFNYSLPPTEEAGPELTRAPFDRFLTGDGRSAESYDDSCAVDTPPPFVPAPGLKEPRGYACC